MLRWRRSSRCGANGECVEVAVGPDAVLVRDSKDRGGPVIAVSSAAWRAFIADLKHLVDP